MRLVDRDEVDAGERGLTILGRDQRQAGRQAIGEATAGAPLRHRAFARAGGEPVGEPGAARPFRQSLRVIGDAGEIEVLIEPVDEREQVGIEPRRVVRRFGQTFGEQRREFAARRLALGERKLIGEVEYRAPGGEVAKRRLGRGGEIADPRLERR